jgi:hypothetical protein
MASTRSAPAYQRGLKADTGEYDKPLREGMAGAQGKSN